MHEAQGASLPSEFKTDFGFQVFKKRADHIGLKITDFAILSILLHCESPGTIVMYAFALKHRYKDANVTTTEVSLAFPDGFLTDEDLNILWDKQKIGSHNMLDCMSAAHFDKRGLLV
jgi:hypothetical protein